MARAGSSRGDQAVIDPLFGYAKMRFFVKLYTFFEHKLSTVTAAQRISRPRLFAVVRE